MVSKVNSYAMVTEKNMIKKPQVTLEIDEALHLALKLHKGNALPEAERLYGRILEIGRAHV